ncbi:MAG: hypothetical protein EHM70_09025 [Chloroflexota bacterium]|nr:MAG: hypothetical protein EHM70_09025 [Chloroflexota bacterium]
MKIKEITVDTAITYEDPPDGSHLPIIDPYDGCTVGCPYCWQLGDPTWNQSILVKTNIAALIRQQLREWPKDQVIFLGSRCDPYMTLEKTYGLTRSCIEALDELGIDCMVTTKAGWGILLRDIDLLRSFRAKLTVLMGLSNLGQLKMASRSSLVQNIDLANRLHQAGISVWAFITPILPGITGVHEMIASLLPDIPVYLDRLRVEQGSLNGEKTLEFIAHHYPHLLPAYQALVNGGADPYFESLRADESIRLRAKWVFE